MNANKFRILFVSLLVLCITVACQPEPAPVTPTQTPARVGDDEASLPPTHTPTPTSTPVPVPPVDIADVTLPNPENILLWLDAAHGVTTDDNGKVAHWWDKLNAVPYTINGELIEAGLNDAPVIRMDGGTGVMFDADLDIGPSTIFVVFKRDAEQATGPDWQRIFSVWDGRSTNDTYAPNYAQYIQHGDAEIAANIFTQSMEHGGRKRFAIGNNAIITSQEHLYGDIAEIIIYQQTLNTYEPVAEIMAYFGEKWGLETQSYTGWTRGAHLSADEIPERTTHNAPLSDQKNSEGWVLYEPWTDEFDDGVLDTEKWLPYNHVWYGRAPARFLPENISEGDGSVKLALRQHEGLEPEDFYAEQDTYEGYSSATLSSLTAKRYGYIEIRAKAGVGSSAFWFYAETYKDQVHNRLEIDVYELGGLEKGYETTYNMNTWVHAMDGVADRFQIGGKWDSGINFADEFHVFGFKWTEAALEYYVDGVLVRRMPNHYWHSPLLLLFDTETMPDWFGVPPADHLPGYHEIDYVRTWVNDETLDDWQGEWTLKNDPRTNNPLASYASTLEPHVDEGTTGEVMDRVWCTQLPTWAPPQDEYSFSVPYGATEEREINLTLWASGEPIDLQYATVTAGSGVVTFTTQAAGIDFASTDIELMASIFGADGAYLDQCWLPVEVSEELAIDAIKIEPLKVNLALNQRFTPKVQVLPERIGSYDLTWDSSDASIATVDQHGTVTAVAAGEATVTASIGSHSAAYEVTVSEVRNLIQNPGFETGEFSPWTHYGDAKLTSESAYSGDAGVHITGVGAAEQLIALAPNTTYRVSGYGKVASDGQTAYLGIKGYNNGTEYSDVQFTTTEYAYGEFTFTTGPDSQSALLYYYVHNGAHAAFGDDFEMVVE